MKREISLGGGVGLFNLNSEIRGGGGLFYLNREIGGGRINLELMKANRGGGGYLIWIGK